MTDSTSPVTSRWRLGLILLAGSVLALVGFILLALRWCSPSVEKQADPFRIVWTFEPPQRGAIAAGTCITDRWIHVACIRDRGLGTSGVLYCLDRFTGEIRWQFDAGGTMLHTISTPALSGSKLYFGEGMHGDLPCKLYCLDAETGKQLWHYPVGGHIESGPCIADRRVYFTAGDDGLQVVHADSGEPLWAYRASGHMDAHPVIDNQRIYGGSGVSRRHRRTEAFCLDAVTGKPLWRVPMNLPVWGGSVVDSGRVFVPLGNGRLIRSEEPPGRPAGALVCLDADSGRQLWRFDVPDSVLVRPAVASKQVYFVSRDGHCYALDRTGTLLWKHDLGSPIVAAPCLFAGRLYVAASEGLLAALDAQTGRRLWAFNIAERFPSMPRLFSAPSVARGKQGRPWVYLGTELRSAVYSAAVLICVEDLMPS